MLFWTFLADLFLYSFEAEFIQSLVHEKKNHSPWPSTYIKVYLRRKRINNGYCHSYVNLLYHSEFVIKATIESKSSVSYLDTLLENDTYGYK